MKGTPLYALYFNMLQTDPRRAEVFYGIYC